MDSFSRHFLLVNNHSIEDHRLLEDIVSACYSLHVVLKSYLSPTIDYSLYDCLSNKHAKLQLYSTSMLVQLLFDLFDGAIYVLLVV